MYGGRVWIFIFLSFSYCLVFSFFLTFSIFSFCFLPLLMVFSLLFSSTSLHSESTSASSGIINTSTASVHGGTSEARVFGSRISRGWTVDRLSDCHPFRACLLNYRWLLVCVSQFVLSLWLRHPDTPGSVTVPAHHAIWFDKTASVYKLWCFL